MKKLIGILVLAVFAAVAVIAMSNRTVVVEKKVDEPVWFYYYGPIGDEHIPSNYGLTGSGGTVLPDCPTGETYLCAILALKDSYSEPINPLTPQADKRSSIKPQR